MRTYKRALAAGEFGISKNEQSKESDYELAIFNILIAQPQFYYSINFFVRFPIFYKAFIKKDLQSFFGSGEKACCKNESALSQ